MELVADFGHDLDIRSRLKPASYIRGLNDPAMMTPSKTNLHTFAAQSDTFALSGPQDDTIPPVTTLESRKRRIRCLPVTSRDRFENGVGKRWTKAQFRSARVDTIAGLRESRKDVGRRLPRTRKVCTHLLAKLLKALAT